MYINHNAKSSGKCVKPIAIFIDMTRYYIEIQMDDFSRNQNVRKSIRFQSLRIQRRLLKEQEKFFRSNLFIFVGALSVLLFYLRPVLEGSEDGTLVLDVRNPYREMIE